MLLFAVDSNNYKFNYYAVKLSTLSTHGVLSVTQFLGLILTRKFGMRIQTNVPYFECSIMYV